MKPTEKIWLPQSHHNKELAQLNYRLQQYDERLQFGRNEETGDWCVFLIDRTLPGPLPVLGFQDAIPHPDAMMARLEAADTRKHGERMLEEINRHNRAIKQELDDKASDATGQLAEGMESFLHAQGKTPYTRVYSKAVESRRTGGKG